MIITKIIHIKKNVYINFMPGCPIIISLSFFLALNLVAFPLYLSSLLSTKKISHLTHDNILLGKNFASWAQVQIFPALL